MRVNSITVNAAGMAPERNVQGSRLQASGSGRQAHAEKNLFGAECKVTISREGRSLNLQQAARKAQRGVQSAESLKLERMLRREEAFKQDDDIGEGQHEELNEIGEQLKELIKQFCQEEKKEEEKQAPDIREEYRRELDEIARELYNPEEEKEEEKLNEKKAVDLSKAYYKIPKNYMDDEDIAQTVGKQLEVLRGIRSQKELQKAENERLAKEAQQLAMQFAGYQEEVDENNRDLLILLKSMREAEKAEDERENDQAAENSNDSSVSGAENPAGDAAANTAAQFVMASAEQAWDVQESIAGLGEDGRQNIIKANELIHRLLDEVENIRASMDDELYSDEQITEMMERLRAAAPKPGLTKALANNDWSDWPKNKNDIVKYKSWGLQNIEDAHEARLKNIQIDPLAGMQQAKRSLYQAAIDEELGELRQSGLDKASQELADEVDKLIDERNDVDRIRQEREEEEKEQSKKAQEKDKESDRQEKKAEEQWLGTRVDILL